MRNSRFIASLKDAKDALAEAHLEALQAPRSAENEEASALVGCLLQSVSELHGRFAHEQLPRREGRHD